MFTEDRIRILKTAYLKIILATALLTTTACSQRWYEVDPGDSDIRGALESASATCGNITSGNYDGASISILSDIINNDLGASVFFKKSDSVFRPESVLQVYDMGIFNPQYVGISAKNLGLNEASVTLVDGIASTANGGQRHFTLYVSFATAQGSECFTYVSRPGEYEFTDDRFSVFMTSADGSTISLESNDLDSEFSDTLGINAKFKIYYYDNFSGEEFNAGQFAPLAGLNNK